MPPYYLLQGALPMPKTKIDIPDEIIHLSILDEKGNLDDGLEPKIPAATLLKLHHYMLLGRRFDERMLRLQRQGRIGTFAPISGQEAAHLGAAAAMRASDWMVPAFRETAAELLRGRTMESVLLFNNGYNEGSFVEPDRNDLPLCVPVGSQLCRGLSDPGHFRLPEQPVGYLDPPQPPDPFFDSGPKSPRIRHQGHSGGRQ
jgi:pyruvate dehydrogenase E1 component alpha subunit